MSGRWKIGLIVGLACLAAPAPGTVVAQQPAAPRGSAASSFLQPTPPTLTTAVQMTSQAPPAPAIGVPIPRIAPIATLSPQTETQFNTNASRASNLTLSSSAPTSPSQSAPSAPGGGGKTLQDCINFWEPATHMTKA